MSLNIHFRCNRGCLVYVCTTMAYLAKVAKLIDLWRKTIDQRLIDKIITKQMTIWTLLGFPLCLFMKMWEEKK